ncbi:MAG: T9SS type A sorting domain-containing protein [Candidatus Marinimicrobia bacterium]|nr:T9SS type A sorting domain-containing protein [Candidatus Neomarinimicrobiota bacterium]
MAINIYRSEPIKMIISFFLLVSALSAQHAPSSERGDPEFRRKTNIEANQVRATVFNHNFTGRTGGSQPTHIPYEWPNGTKQHYIALAGLFVGSLVVTENGSLKPLVTSPNYATDPVDGSSLNFEPVPGYFEPNSNSIAISTNFNSWPDCWPDKLVDTTDSGWCGSWDGYFGKNYFIEGAEIYSRSSDDLNHLINGTYFPDTTDYTRQGAGIMIENRTIAWNTPELDDVLFHIYKMKNDGTKHLDTNVVALWIADLLGGDGDSDDDQVSYELDQQVLWSFDGDNIGNANYGPDTVGTAAHLILETPDDNGISSIRVISTAISPNSADLWNDWMAPGEFWEPVHLSGDYNLVISSGYFPLAPGEEQQFIYATIFSRDETEMWNKIETVQTFYNNGFSPNPQQFAVMEMDPKFGYVYANDGVSSDSIYLQLNDYFGTPFPEKNIQITNDLTTDTLWLVTDESGATAFQYTTAILPESGEVNIFAQSIDPVYGLETTTLPLNIYPPELIGVADVPFPFDLELQPEGNALIVSWDAEHLPENSYDRVDYQFKVYRNGSFLEYAPGNLGLHRGYWSRENMPDLDLERYTGLQIHGLPLMAEYRIAFIEPQGNSSTEFGIFDGFVILPSIPVNFCVLKRFPEFIGTDEEWQDIPFAFFNLSGPDSIFNFDATESDVIIFLDDVSDSTGMGPTWWFNTYSGIHPEDYNLPASGDTAFLSTRYQYLDETPTEDDDCYHITRFFSENSTSIYFQPMTESLPSEIVCSSTLSIDPTGDHQNFTPRTLILYQNYPNPFNPTTTIKYGLPVLSDVTLTIYDIRGREIISWKRLNQDAGWYDINWHGDNQNGRQVSTGMYFARLQAGDYSSVVKMVYLK